MQSGKIIACVGMRDGSMVVWFDGGKARTYSTAKDFGISDPVLRRTATVSEDGDNISWEDGTVVWGYDIVNKGKPFDFVTLEKKRILDELTICRKEANFSQTHLGMAGHQPHRVVHDLPADQHPPEAARPARQDPRDRRYRRTRREGRHQGGVSAASHLSSQDILARQTTTRPRAELLGASSHP